MQRTRISPFLILTGAVFVALLLGLIAASASRYLIALALAGLFSGFLLWLQGSAILWMMSALVFVVAGSVMYFGHISQALLAPYALALVLVLKLVHFDNQRMTGPTVLEWLLWLFAGICLLATAVGQPQPLIAMAGLKSLIGFIPVALLVASGRVGDASISRLIRWIAWIPVVQVPFVLYQYFVVARGRGTSFGAGGVAWDSVVGSFGGNPEGGGASGVLAFLCVACALLAFSLYRENELRFRSFLLILLSSMLCLTLAEVKVIAVLMPAAVCMYALPRFRRHPMATVAVLVASVLGAVAIVFSYSMLHYTARQNRVPDAQQLYDYTFGYSTDPNLINRQTGEMGRTTALRFWWETGFRHNSFNGTLGFGPGASRGKSAFGVGDVARKYPFFIDRSAASQMLWDIGWLGLAAFLVVPVVGALAALRFRVLPQLPGGLRALGTTAPALLAMSVVMVPYGRDILEVPALSFFYMLVVGCVALIMRRQRELLPHG